MDFELTTGSTTAAVGFQQQVITTTVMFQRTVPTKCHRNGADAFGAYHGSECVLCLLPSIVTKVPGMGQKSQGTTLKYTGDATLAPKKL